MISKVRLLEISELNLAEKIEQMDEKCLEDYSGLLNSFVEAYPEHEENIKSAMENKDYDTLSKHLTAVCELLEKIYADELAQDCRKKINGLENIKYEKLEAFISYFLANLSMLSIDIQMAEQDIDDSAAEIIKNAIKTESAMSDNKILAVDDTAFFLTMLKTALQNTKYKVTCVASGRDALKYLEKNTTNLFLLDIEMPGMDGYELAAKIRENGHKAPIIFLTGNSRRENVAKAMRAGAADFIIKPINKELLLTKLAKYTMQED
ncbi:response regulator [Treponema sp. R6D11]